MPRPTSLRARLVLGVIVLAALGLALADVATYASLRSFLFHRTDSALQKLPMAPSGDARKLRQCGEHAANTET